MTTALPRRAGPPEPTGPSVGGQLTPPTTPRGARDWVRTVRDDHRVNEGLWAPGFQVLAVHRFGAWLDSDAPQPIRWPGSALYRLLYTLCRNLYGIELPRTARVGKGVRIARPHGIFVHPRAVIGDSTVIRQGVAIGASKNSDPVAFLQQAPQVGARVSLGMGCVLVGGVKVGDGGVIGPNTTVTTDVPAGATVLPLPPHVTGESVP